jgi:hypothetical protein
MAITGMLTKRRIAQLHAVELSRFELVKLTAATGTKGMRTRSASPILLTLC